MTSLPDKKTKTKTIIALVSLVTAILAVANIVASNMVATTGNRLQLLNEQIANLKDQNQEIEAAISKRKSLSYIEKQAEELGLVPISQTFNLATPEPLAQAP